MRCCCKKRRIPVDSMEEQKLGDITGNEITVDGEKPNTSAAADPEEIVDPDAIPNRVVILAVIFLVLFSLAFATMFFLTETAFRSLQAEIEPGTIKCALNNIHSKEVIKCEGKKDMGDCIVIDVHCEDNSTYQAYEYYHDFYSTEERGLCFCDACSKTRCADSERVINGIKYPLNFIKECCTANSTMKDWTPQPYPANALELSLYDDMIKKSADFYKDRSKPGYVFYQLNHPGTNRVVLSNELSYVILIVPGLLMSSVTLLIIYLFISNRLKAAAVYRPITPITALHKQYKGKWYIKEPTDKPQMSAFEKLKELKKTQQAGQAAAAAAQ